MCGPRQRCDEPYQAGGLLILVLVAPVTDEQVYEALGRRDLRYNRTTVCPLAEPM